MQIFENFLNKLFTRDLFYCIGGLSIILCFLYYFDLFPFKGEIQSYNIIYLILIGYVIGYLTQELLSLIRIVRTTLPRHIKTIDCLLYRLFVGQKCLSKKEDKNYQKLDTKLKDLLKKKNKFESLSQFKRIIDLKQIGSTIGSNWLICSLIIILKYFNSERPRPIFILVFGILVFIFSLTAITINRIKLANQIEFIYENIDLINKND